MQLPNQWLWDRIDEFVYQFQSFCQFRAKMKDKTEQEIALLRQFDQVANMKTDAFCRQISAIEDGSSWKFGKPHIHKLLWYVNMSYWSLHFLHQIPWFLYYHLQSIGKKVMSMSYPFWPITECVT